MFIGGLDGNGLGKKLLGARRELGGFDWLAYDD